MSLLREERGTPHMEPRPGGGERGRFNVASPCARLSLGQYHTSYLCQNLSVFTSLLHVTKPHRLLSVSEQRRGEAWQLDLLKTGRISTLPACYWWRGRRAVLGIDLVVAEQLYLDLIIPSHHAHQSISLIVGLFATS